MTSLPGKILVNLMFTRRTMRRQIWHYMTVRLVSVVRVNTRVLLSGSAQSVMAIDIRRVNCQTFSIEKSQAETLVYLLSKQGPVVEPGFRPAQGA